MSSLPGSTPRGYERFSTLSPQQSDIFSQLQEMLAPRAAGQEDTSRFTAPFMRQFQEETVPGLAERFSGLGAGAQSSSAFQQSLGGAAAGLQENLASIGAGREDKALQQLMNLLGIDTEGMVQKSMPFWKQLLLSLTGGISQAATSFGLGKIR